MKNEKKGKKNSDAGNKDVLDEIIEEINALDSGLPEDKKTDEPASPPDGKIDFDYGFLDDGSKAEKKQRAEQTAAPAGAAQALADDAAQQAEKQIQQPDTASEQLTPSAPPPLQRVRQRTAAPDRGANNYGQSDGVRNAAETIPQPMRKKKKKKRKKRHSRLPGVLILTTFIFGVSIILSLVIIGYGKDMFGIGKADQEQLITIPENATTEEISFILEDYGIIKSPKAFQLFSQLRNSDTAYIAGDHFLKPNMAYETIINHLTNVQEEEEGETVQITFPEGITLLDAANLLEEKNICKADDFLFYFNAGGYGYDFEALLPSETSLKLYRMEGYLFPDTYFFNENTDVNQVCQKIYSNFNNKMTADRLARIDELGMTLDEVITLASIVQKEAATTDVMIMVASVFWNRLDNPDIFPKLESDPTTNYSKDIVAKHLDVYDQKFVDAYDTYSSA